MRRAEKLEREARDELIAAAFPSADHLSRAEIALELGVLEKLHDEQPREAQRLAVAARVKAVDAAVSNCIKSLRSGGIPQAEWVAEIHEALRAARHVRTRKQIKALVAERHGISLPRQRKRRLAR